VTIPIGNVYNILLYAWNHAQRRRLVHLDVAGSSDLPNLFAHVLALETSSLLSQGLARDYVSAEEEHAGIRGRVLLGESARRQSLLRGRAYCVSDDMSYDVWRNRLLKGTLRLLLNSDKLARPNRDAVRHVYNKLDLVSDIDVHISQFRTVQSHSLARHYDFALRLCQLIVSQARIDKASGNTRFYEFVDNQAVMWKLFEDFVLNFYRIERPEWQARRLNVRWHDAQTSEHDRSYLPIMKTDVFLRIGPRRIVLDAKFYERALRTHRGHERINSSHLYQVYAYLSNLAASHPEHSFEGLLLYPVVETPFRLTYRLNGHRIGIRSIDLTQPWDRIHDELLAVCN
jgi:5-methylcytosine-specific restriction enzyme subunit McrC